MLNPHRAAAGVGRVEHDLGAGQVVARQVGLVRRCRSNRWPTTMVRRAGDWASASAVAAKAAERHHQLTALRRGRRRSRRAAMGTTKRRGSKAWEGVASAARPAAAGGAERSVSGTHDRNVTKFPY
ncbi:hypothetical protein ACTMU2_00490 [Cupriavidus basilensis]